jgi:DNA (cytosine-5)-methyltransferase 1
VTLFNEIEPFACDWLASLFPSAAIDRRSIKELSHDDLNSHARCHFFAGIGGWELALQEAGWPDDCQIWTGSCPCQPFSNAGKRKGIADERHLWPDFFRLIEACRPACVMGEQVASKDGLAWLDGVQADLESANYSCWAVDSCAAGVNSPHIRQRLYWVGYAKVNRDWSLNREPKQSDGAKVEARGPGLSNGMEQPISDRRSREWTPQRRTPEASWTGETNRLAIPDSTLVQRISPAGEQSLHEQSGGINWLEHSESDGRDAWRAESSRRSVASGCGINRLGNSSSARPRERILQPGISGRAGLSGSWEAFDVASCRDGKSRRISAQSGDEPLANGLPSRRNDERMGFVLTRLRELGFSPEDSKRILREARRNRTGRLKGYGNAIVPAVAVEFIKTVMEELL